MKATTARSRSCLDNKGIIFTLDMFIAIILVSTILFFTTIYVSRASEDKFSQLYTYNVGSDVAAYLDNSGTLTTFNPTQIQNTMDNTLPAGYALHLQIISGKHSLIDIGDDIPTDRFVGAGKRYFYGDDDHGIVRYWIWLKA